MDRRRIMDELQSTEIDQRFLIDALYCIEREVLAAATKIRSIAQEDQTTTNLQLSQRVEEVKSVVSEMTKAIQDAAVKSEVDLRKIAIEAVKDKLISEGNVFDPNETTDEDVTNLPQNSYISERSDSFQNSSVAELSIVEPSNLPQRSKSSTQMPTSQELKAASLLPTGVYFVKESQFIPVSNFSSSSISPEGFSSHEVNGKLVELKTLNNNAKFFSGQSSSSGPNYIQGKLVAVRNSNLKQCSNSSDKGQSLQRSNLVPRTYSAVKGKLLKSSNLGQQSNSSPQGLNNEPRHFLEVKTPEGSKHLPVINLSDGSSSSKVSKKLSVVKRYVQVNTNQGPKFVPLSCLPSKSPLTEALSKRQGMNSSQLSNLTQRLTLSSQSSASQGNSLLGRSSSSEQSNSYSGSLLAQMLSRSETVPSIETYDCS